jgi:hypothetical protein
MASTIVISQNISNYLSYKDSSKFHPKGQADEPPKFMRVHLCQEQMPSAIQEAQKDRVGF